MNDWKEFLSRFDFPLPEDRIALFPPEERSAARLLIVDRKTGSLSDGVVKDFPGFMEKEDLVIFNETKVSRRRLFLRRKSGASIEALMLAERDGTWESLVRGATKLRQGERLDGPEGLEFEFIRSKEKTCLKPLRENKAAWRSLAEAEEYFEKNGEVPIPPYLKRKSGEIDETRYQTIYARETGSVAAPTAGFHFSHEMMKSVEAKANVCNVELRIGYGTFAPLAEENFQEKKLHTETYRISPSSADQLNACLGRRIAIGTTSLRACESNFREFSAFTSGTYTTDLFLFPPDTIQSIDILLTNFHLPASSLFLLVCALGGSELMIKAYRHAIEMKYRFYSYGDAMLIL